MKKKKLGVPKQNLVEHHVKFLPSWKGNYNYDSYCILIIFDSYH